MRKNGFTLVEILAVIVILSILMTLAGSSVFGIIENQKKALLKEQIKNLGDTAISYVESKNWYLKDCPNTFNPSTPNSSQKNKCYREVKVQDMIDAKFFENKNDLCKANSILIVYKKKESAYSELQSYVPDGACSY